MTSRLDRRTATLLAAVALPPLAFLATGQSPAPPLAAGASILALSAALAILERDLRTVFCIESDTVYGLDIGTHAIYRT